MWKTWGEGESIPYVSNVVPGQFYEQATGRGIVAWRGDVARTQEGKKPVLVTLNEKNVKRAKKREDNFSGLLDRLLADWINR